MRLVGIFVTYSAHCGVCV